MDVDGAGSTSTGASLGYGVQQQSLATAPVAGPSLLRSSAAPSRGGQI
jgi:hypothetical protein